MPDQYFSTYSPKVRVKFKDLATKEEIVDASNDLVSLSTNKAYGRAAGTWQMILTTNTKHDGAFTGYRYDEFLVSDNMVTIEIDPGDGLYWPVMIGLVDRVSIVRQGGIQPVRQVKISGQDFGKLLSKHNIGWNPEVSKQDIPDQAGGSTPWQTYMRLVLLTMGTAKDLIKRLYEMVLEDMPDAAWPIDYDSSKCTDTWIVHNQSFTRLTQQVAWDTMKQCAHEPFNMLHCDTDVMDVNKFKIILENQPIDAAGKLDRSDSARIHTIDDTDIVMSDIGVSDAERINMLCYWPITYKLAVTSSGLQVAMAHPELTTTDKTEGNKMTLHGFNVKVQEDNFVPRDRAGTKTNEYSEDMFADYKANASRLWNWWSVNHTLESGTFQVHIRPDIRAGHCLLVRQGNSDVYHEYLVEQVAHQCAWNPLPQFLTTLHVTRGQKAPKNKTEHAGPPTK